MDEYNRQLIRISKVIRSKFRSTRYEITPESYSGPWEIEPNTVLEIVSSPK